ncbi:hypothetical protein [Ramlibacter sp. WS9]|uniref:hypothetical protein n=1 Tax=Ramlibacter sp. WS9 TaxID=1882741 RepID=UPI001141FFB8|nr:hypothetical protein [Ramlibacter sp. WS9]ROZ77646.1 VCBS repeat-containing protein [Ramlibacter sp. WS9]
MPHNPAQSRVRRPRAKPGASDAATAATALSSDPTFVGPDFQGLPATVAWPMQGLDVVLATVDLARSTPCMLVQNAGQTLLGLVQMCGWDTLSPQWSGLNEGAQVPVLIWNTTSSIQPMPVSAGGFPGTQAWTVSGTDKYYAADVDGDGVDEIFASQNARIGVFKWNGDALYVWWSASGATGTGSASTWWPDDGDSYLPVQFGLGTASGQLSMFASSPYGLAVLAWAGDGFNAVWSAGTAEVPGAGGAAGWTLETGDAWWTMDVVGQGFDSILVSRPGQALGLVQWDSDANAPSLVWSVSDELLNQQGSGAWPLQASDQLAPAQLAVGAYYADSLVLFNTDDCIVAVAQFNNDPVSPQLQVLWTGDQAIPNPGGTDLPLTSGDTLVLASLQIGPPSVLFAQPGSIAAVSWDSSQLIVEWVAQGSSFPGAGGVSSWNTEDDQYMVVAGPGLGQQQLLAYKAGYGSCGLLAFDANGNATCAWQAGSNGPPAFPGWGLSLVASGPQCAYPPFSGTSGSLQAQIYAAASNEMNGCEDGDIRSLYTKTNAVGDAQRWIQEVQNMDLSALLPPGTLPGTMEAAQAIWQAMQQDLIAELQNLAGVYGLYANLLTVAAAIDTQMDADLAYVIGMVAPSSDAPQVSFSWQNLMSALASGVPALATASSAKGSGLALTAQALLVNDQYGAPQVAYTGVQGIIDMLFGNVSQLNALGQNQIAGDFVKAGMVASLAQQGWAWPTPGSSTDDVATDMAAATQAGNRIQFYAVVIPAAYTIYYQQTSDSHLVGARWADTPGWAGWTTSTGGEPYAYAIATGDGLLLSFPPQGMMSDVWATVQPADFYLGNGIWAGINRVNY